VSGVQAEDAVERYAEGIRAVARAAAQARVHGEDGGWEGTCAAECSLRDAGNLRRGAPRGERWAPGRRSECAGEVGVRATLAAPEPTLGGNEVGTNCVLSRPLLSGHVILIGADLQAIVAEDGQRIDRGAFF
jgi:hypothetical protein